MGLLDIILGVTLALSDDDKKKKDKNNDLYDLDDDEKELVRKGEYDPWNFEEEDTDEDDFYHEDDY